MASTGLPKSVVDPTEANHYAWGGGCDGWRLVDEDSLSVIEERVPPGGREEWHTHVRARQFFYVLAGVAEMCTTGGAVRFSEGSGVTVPAGTAHQLANAADEDLRFLVVSTPTTRGDREPSPTPALAGE